MGTSPSSPMCPHSPSKSSMLARRARAPRQRCQNAQLAQLERQKLRSEGCTSTNVCPCPPRPLQPTAQAAIAALFVTASRLWAGGVSVSQSVVRRPGAGSGDGVLWTRQGRFLLPEPAWGLRACAVLGCPSGSKSGRHAAEAATSAGAGQGSSRACRLRSAGHKPRRCRSAASCGQARGAGHKVRRRRRQARFDSHPSLMAPTACPRSCMHIATARHHHSPPAHHFLHALEGPLQLALAAVAVVRRVRGRHQHLPASGLGGQGGVGVVAWSAWWRRRGGSIPRALFWSGRQRAAVVHAVLSRPLLPALSHAL